MKLSYIKEHIDGNAIIAMDGVFNNLGIVSSKVKNNTLLYLDNPSLLRNIENISGVCLLCNENVYKELADKENVHTCVVENPKDIFYKLHNHLAQMTDFYKKITDRVIPNSCRIDPSAVIHDGVLLGENVIVESHVAINSNTIIGNDVVVRSGSVIGGEGFQFLKCGNTIIGIKHAGRVRICDHVEIQANCCIDRAVFDDETTIGEYTKLDNLVHIAHNVKIGSRCLLAANANLGGYVTIGDDVWVGPSATISNRIFIGNNARISIGSVVIRNVLESQEVYGNPALII